MGMKKVKLASLLSKLNTTILYLNPDIVELPAQPESHKVPVPKQFTGDGTWAHFPFGVYYVKIAFDSDIPIFAMRVGDRNMCVIGKTMISNFLTAIKAHNDGVSFTKVDGENDDMGEDETVGSEKVIYLLSKSFGANLKKFMMYVNEKAEEMKEEIEDG